MFDNRRNIAAELPKNYKQCIITAMYPWDGNAFPGNEFWLGYTKASMDPAAASCSTIGFVQNSEINSENINGSKCRVYFKEESGYTYSTLSELVTQNNWEEKCAKSIPYAGVYQGKEVSELIESV